MQSFQRNLNIYGFTRLSKGPYAAGYVHAEFGRDIDEIQLEWIIRDTGLKNKVSPKAAPSEFTKDAIDQKYHSQMTPNSLQGPLYSQFCF